jgi:predicted HTH domain antitoxin
MMFGMSDTEISHAMLEGFASQMYHEGKISLAQGKELLSMKSITDFMDVLYAHDIPMIDYEPGELAAEVNGLLGALA